MTASLPKLLAFGSAPLPFEPLRLQRSGNLRTWQFVKPLLDAGHEVRLLAARTPGSYPKDVPPVVEKHTGKLHYVSLTMERFIDAAFLQQQHDDFAPDAVLGINTFPASRAAALDTECPIWCDLNGWVMAEAQTKAATYDDDRYLSHFWNLERPILDRADVISAVSQAQAHALVGELATRGRLSGRMVGYEMCRHIPNALVETDTPIQPGRIRGHLVPSDAFVLLWVGGYNTWTDIDLLFDALDHTMARLPDLHFVSTGGALKGHDEVTFERFRKRIAASSFASRVHFAGWVPTAQVPSYYAESDLGCNVDRASYETTFGARNRINDMLKAGLPILTTLGTEISRQLADRSLVLTAKLGDAAGFAQQILWAHGHRQGLRAMGRDAKLFAQSTYSYARTTRPLVQWARSPSRAPDAGNVVELDESISFFGHPPNGQRAPEMDLATHCRNLENQLAIIQGSKIWRLREAYLRIMRRMRRRRITSS